jgi:phosphinothricin acetyltransferase
MIRVVDREKDAAAICAIYNYYIEHTVISFEEIPLKAAEMEDRIRRISARYPFFVWEDSGEIAGYAYLNTFKERAAYRFSAEDTIYLKQGCEGRGIGAKLLAALLDEAKKPRFAVRGDGDEKHPLHAIVSCITIPNTPSIALHEKFGFSKIAHFQEIGYKMGRRLDVGYWELVLPASEARRGV